MEPLRKTQESVGPGSYAVHSTFYKPQQSNFNRDGLQAIRQKTNKGSIRSNFDFFDSDEEEELAKQKISPGPGAYQTMTSSFGVQKEKRQSSIQVFGSTVSRFIEKPIGSNLGPGQYKPRSVGKNFNSALAVAGSAAFKSQKRPDIVNRAA